MTNKRNFLLVFCVIVSGCTIHFKNGQTITWPAPSVGDPVASTTYPTSNYNNSTPPKYAYGLPPGGGYAPVKNSGGYVPVTNSSPSSTPAKYAYGLPPNGGYTPVKNSGGHVPVANSTHSSTPPKYAYGLPPGDGYTPVANNGSYVPVPNSSPSSTQSKYAYGLSPGDGYTPLTNTGTPPGMKYSYDAPPSAGYTQISNAFNSIGTKYSYDAPLSTGYAPAANTGSSTQMKYGYGMSPGNGYAPVQNNTGYTPVANNGGYVAVPNNGYVSLQAQYTPANYTQPQSQNTSAQSQPTPKSTASTSLNTASATDAANSLKPPTQSPSWITFDGGAQTPFLGGDIALTYNNFGVKTITTTAGEGLLRFSASHSSDQNNALCWSPGFDVPGVSDIGLNACAGTDGARFGASGGIGIFTGSFVIPSQIIPNTYMNFINGAGNLLGTGLYNAAPNVFNGSH